MVLLTISARESLNILLTSESLITEAQERNDRALAVLNRVQHKLTGSLAHFLASETRD